MSIFGRKKEDGSDVPEGAMPASRDSDLAVPTFRAPAANNAPVGMPPKPATPPTLPPRLPGSAPSMPRPGAAEDRRTLVVGRGISLQGTVADAERLVVEGMVDSQMIQA